MSAHHGFQSATAGVEQPLGPEHRRQQSADLIATPDICQQLGISRWTWRRWVVSGAAPAPVPGLPGHPRWRVSDIEAFLRGSRRFFTGHLRAATVRERAQRARHAESVAEVGPSLRVNSLDGGR